MPTTYKLLLLDLVPKSRFGGSRTKKNMGGGRGRERRIRDLAKYESKRAPIGCSITDAKAPRVCYFFRSQCQKHAKELVLLKKIKPTLSDFNRTR